MNSNCVNDLLAKELDKYLSVINKATSVARYEITTKTQNLNKLENFFTKFKHESDNTFTGDINTIMEHFKIIKEAESRSISRRINCLNWCQQTLNVGKDVLTAYECELKILQVSRMITQNEEANGEVREAVKQKKKLLWSNHLGNPNNVGVLKTQLRYDKERMDVIQSEIEKKMSTIEALRRQISENHEHHK